MIGPRLIIDNRDATHRRYKGTGRAELLDEFLRLNNEVDERFDQEHSSFLHQHLVNEMDNKKNIWEGLRNLGLLPKRNVEELRGFSPGELNAHFAGASVSLLKNIDDSMNIILSANEEGFSFKPVSLDDVVLGIFHFLSDNITDWLKSYLIDRTQSVKIGNDISKPYDVLSGVSQGSDLGPLSFLIFINDINSVIEHSQFLLFEINFAVSESKCDGGALDLSTKSNSLNRETFRQGGALFANNNYCK